MDPRTHLLLEAPIARTLLKLGAPNVRVMFAQAAVGLIETCFALGFGLVFTCGMLWGGRSPNFHPIFKAPAGFALLPRAPC